MRGGGSLPSCPSGDILTDRSGPAFRERYAKLFTSSPDLHAELVSRVTQGRIVIDQERIERVWFVV